MSKISLLTIHWGLSYGAIFQAYATCKILESKQHDVTVVNLIPSSKHSQYPPFRLFLLCFMRFQFWAFKKKYFPKMTRKMRAVDFRLMPKSDYIVVGSDQVWNIDLTSSNYSFFVDFDNEAKKVSLASSFGNNEWNESPIVSQKVTTLLQRFKAISVREHTGAQILKENFGLNSTVLIDPTLAFGYFEDLVLNHKEIPQIYSFFIKNNPHYAKIVKYIADDLGLGVFEHSRFSYYTKNGPRHWLTYIRNASLIITDSFHGVAFCILFKKDFYVLCGEKKKFTRIENLLNLLNLRERIVDSIEDYELRKEQLHEHVDFQKVDFVLEYERQKYNAFVEENIK